MSESDFTIDHTEMTRSFESILSTAIPKHGKEALKRVAKLIITDALEENPTVPKGRKRAKAGKRKGVGGTLRQSWKIEVQPNGDVEFGFDTPYATHQHKGARKDGSRQVKNYSEPGSGKEFVSKKIVQFKDVYTKDIADYIESKGNK